MSSDLLSKAEVASSSTIIVGSIRKARANPTYNDDSGAMKGKCKKMIRIFCKIGREDASVPHLLLQMNMLTHTSESSI